jgi:hypothetical protein
MPVRSLCAAIVVVVLAGCLGAAAAWAAPANDAPQGAGAFEPYIAAAGKPTELAAIAELVDANPDPGVPRCLGANSFQRTVWYRLPEVGATQWVTISAVGRTLGVIDLAAFISPQNIPPAVPTEANLREPNVCDGVGAGSSDAAQEPSSAVSFLIPPYRPVYVQVGRRGPVNSADAERAFLYVDTIASEALGAPRGDVADASTPRVRTGESFVTLAGATITEEDPAEPTCPSLGTVWRRFVPNDTGKRLITVRGSTATTLTAYAGRKPRAEKVLDCVNRETGGDLQMVVPTRKNQTIWIRLGTERTTGDEEASVEVSDGENAVVVDGGPGGFDPTRGGPGGGFPDSCALPHAEDGGVTGARLRGVASAFNRFAKFPVSISVNRDVRLCDVTLTLKGPSGLEYAKARLVSLSPGKHRVLLPRLRTLVQGGYVLRVDALSSDREPVKVRSNVSGRLVRK